MVLKKLNGKWALVSKESGRPLKYFGSKKPSHKAVLHEERRIQFFKNRLHVVKGYRRGRRVVKRYVRRV